MKIRLTLISVLVALLFAGCASKPEKPQRFELRGFSFAVPAPAEDGRSWNIAQQTPDLLIFGKPGAFESEVFIVQVSVIRLPPLGSPDGLLQHVKAAQQRELDPRRFRILKHELSSQPVNGEPCALAHLEAVDRAVSGTTGPTANTMLETLTLTCPHPGDRTTGINVTYSHQYFPEDRDPLFLERGSAIVGGLSLGKL